MTDQFDEAEYEALMAEEEQRQREWDEYWAGLSEEDKAKERQMMAAYAEEKRAEREARGFDA